MIRYLRSFSTASLIAVTVVLFSVHVVAPLLPPVVGPPDFREVRTLNLPVYKHLYVMASDGSVRVKTVPLALADGIEISAEIRIWGRRASENSDYRAYESRLVEALGSQEVLRITSEPLERPPGIDVRIDYTILVPEGTDIDISGTNGNIWISEGCGRVAVNSTNSDIEILGPSGDVVAKNINGRIRIVGARDETTAHTENGNIYAHMRGGTLEASSRNGYIVARLLDPSVTSLHLRAENAGITVVMREDSSATVDASTERGYIRSDFDILNEIDPGNKRHLIGTWGHGDTLLNLKTTNGNIWLARD